MFPHLLGLMLMDVVSIEDRIGSTPLGLAAVSVTGVLLIRPGPPGVVAETKV